MSTDRSQRAKPISNFMTEDVRAASPDATLTDVASLLMDAGCHHVPIVDEGRLVGIVSSRDLLHAYRADSDATTEPGKLAAEVMTADVQTIYQDQPVEAAIERIGRGDLHSLIVLDHDDRLVGIVTHRDLLRYLMI